MQAGLALKWREQMIYSCANCGHIFSVTITSKAMTAKCPRCDSLNLNFSTTASSTIPDEDIPHYGEEG